MMSAVKHPLHLLAIAAGAIAVTLVVWILDSSGGHIVAYAGVAIALLAAVDLARRLGLEPANDPARPEERKAD